MCIICASCASSVFHFLHLCFIRCRCNHNYLLPLYFIFALSGSTDATTKAPDDGHITLTGGKGPTGDGDGPPPPPTDDGPPPPPTRKLKVSVNTERRRKLETVNVGKKRGCFLKSQLLNSEKPRVTTRQRNSKSPNKPSKSRDRSIGAGERRGRSSTNRKQKPESGKQKPASGISEIDTDEDSDVYEWNNISEDRLLAEEVDIKDSDIYCIDEEGWSYYLEETNRILQDTFVKGSGAASGLCSFDQRIRIQLGTLLTSNSEHCQTNFGNFFQTMGVVRRTGNVV